MREFFDAYLQHSTEDREMPTAVAAEGLLHGATARLFHPRVDRASSEAANQASFLVKGRKIILVLGFANTVQHEPR